MDHKEEAPQKDESRSKRSGNALKTILRKLAIYSVPVIVVLVVMDLCLRAALPPETLMPYMKGEAAIYTLKIDRFLERPAPDVVFFGSSRIRDGMIPDRFGKELSAFWKRPAEVFNMGLSGARMEEYYTLATSHMHDPPPPYVVIGISGTDLTRVDRFIYASRYLWHFPNLVSYIQRTPYERFRGAHVKFYLESAVGSFWYLFAQKDALCNWLTCWIKELSGCCEDGREALRSAEETRRFVSNVMAEDGFQRLIPDFMKLKDIFKKGKAYVRKKIPKTELNKDPKMLNASGIHFLDLLVSELKKKGVKVALVETPPSPYLQALNPVLFGDDFRKWITKVAKELDLLFIPLPPKTSALSNELYSDFNHLTLKGADRYTHLIFKKLRDAGFFDESSP